MTQIRKINRYPLCCPILLSSANGGAGSRPLLSRTENVSSRGAYVCGTPQFLLKGEVAASIFYEISLFSRQSAESRFLIRFLGRIVWQDENGFALEFSTTESIVSLAEKEKLTAAESRAAGRICFRSLFSGNTNVGG